VTYEEALQIAMEELYDAVIDLRYNNKGYEARIEKMCNRLLTARNAIHKGLEDMQTKREWVGLTENEILDICKQHADDPVTEAGFLLNVFSTYEAKLKEKNTP
jgi:hypothetical protein